MRLKKYVVRGRGHRRPCPSAARRSASSASRSPTPTSTTRLDGPAISEEEHEVVLHEEEAVVEKRAVPKERVRLEKDDEDRASSDGLRDGPQGAHRGRRRRAVLRRMGRPLEAWWRRTAGRLPARRHRRQVLAVRHRQADIHRVQRGQHVRLGGGADLLRAAVVVPGADRAGVDRGPRRRPCHDDQGHHGHGHQGRAELRGRHVRGTDQVDHVEPGTAGVLFVVGLATALWSASAYVGAFMRAANIVYETPEGRPFWKLRPLQILVTLVMLVLLALVAVALVLTGPIVTAVAGRSASAAPRCRSGTSPNGRCCWP